MIEIADATLRLGAHELLRDFSWRLPDPGIYLLLGGTGSGKSTLCDLLCGARRPQRGQVLIDGEPLYRVLGGYAAPIFRARADEAILDPEPLEAYFDTELRQAGGRLSLLEPLWPELEARLSRGRQTTLIQLSHGELLLAQLALAAVIPTRLAVLDGHLSYLDEDARAAAARMLSLANQHQERFVLLTSCYAPVALPPLEDAFLLYGRQPLGIARLDPDAPLAAALSSGAAPRQIQLQTAEAVAAEALTGPHTSFTVLTVSGRSITLRFTGMLDACLASLREMGVATEEVDFERAEG